MLNKLDGRWTIAIQDPLSKPREEFSDLIELLASADSPVGIDVKYTHAVIIDYLRQIAARLESIETALAERKS